MSVLLPFRNSWESFNGPGSFGSKGEKFEPGPEKMSLAKKPDGPSGVGNIWSRGSSGLGGSRRENGDSGWSVDFGVTESMGSGRKTWLLNISLGGSMKGNGECGCIGVAGVTAGGRGSGVIGMSCIGAG